MWPLLICSILSLTVILERLFFWWRERRRLDRSMHEQLFSRIETGDIQGVLALGDREGNAFKSLDHVSRMLVAGLAHRSQGLHESIEIAAEEEMGRMKQGLGILDTIITMAPMLGILGTVLGIIESFDLLGSSGIEDPKAVTGGIAQALITTAAGLSVAIMTLVPFNYFVTKVNRAARDMNKIAARFEAACRKSGDDR